MRDISDGVPMKAPVAPATMPDIRTYSNNSFNVELNHMDIQTLKPTNHYKIKAIDQGTAIRYNFLS